MQSRLYFLSLAAGALACLSFGATLPTQAGSPKLLVAAFSEDDAQFSETITLYADGSYQQSETEKKASLYGPHPTQIPLPSEMPFPSPLGAMKRSGAWRVLDKENGQPIAFKTLAALPKAAVITLAGAMPFGITWERQPPFQSHGTRTLPAEDFHPVPTTKKTLPN